jgi:hypothetical protein
MKKSTLIFLPVILLLPFSLFAATEDSLSPVRTPIHKNVIKFNPTPMLLWNAQNLTFSYERILTPRQSVSIELGYLVFPQLIEDSLMNLISITSRQKRGINASLEYRFYLTALNTRPAPAGLYLGPYLTYYRYQFKNGFDMLNGSLDSTGVLKGDYWSVNLGFELGYQFVFWKRLTLDLVLVGPSISYYGGKSNISGSFDADQVREINEALYDRLIERFPAVQNLSVNKTFQETGKLDIVRWGFRYLLQVGFHF